VTLSVTASKSAYAHGETIQLAPVVRNQGTTSVRISGSSTGTIRLTSIKKNGVAVPHRETAIDFDDDLKTLLEQSLQSLKPGGVIALTPLSSSNDTLLGGQALVVVVYQSNGKNRAAYYLVGAPGAYEVTLQYQYPASTTGAYSQPSNFATAKFSVAP
jgi:hypothetical protein